MTSLGRVKGEVRSFVALKAFATARKLRLRIMGAQAAGSPRLKVKHQSVALAAQIWAQTVRVRHSLALISSDRAHCTQSTTRATKTTNNDAARK